MVERDYSILTPSKWLSWADLCVSEGVGILLRPLSTLASEAGGRGLIRTVTGLSLQYHKCWVILYQEDQSRSGYNKMKQGFVCVFYVVPHKLSLPKKRVQYLSSKSRMLFILFTYLFCLLLLSYVH